MRENLKYGSVRDMVSIETTYLLDNRHIENRETLRIDFRC